MVSICLSFTPHQESLRVCPSCFITHLIHSGYLLLANEQRSIFFIYLCVLCVFQGGSLSVFWCDSGTWPALVSLKTTWRGLVFFKWPSVGRQRRKPKGCWVQITSQYKPLSGPCPWINHTIVWFEIFVLTFLSFFLLFFIYLYIYIYICRFQREFTQGVAPDWTITRIEHSKLLDWAASWYETVGCSLTTTTTKIVYFPCRKNVSEGSRKLD